MTKLYEISSDLLKINEEQDVTQEWVQDTIEALDLEFNDKAENIIKYAKNLKSESEALKEEAKRLNERSKSALKTRERILNYLMFEMNKLDKKRITCGIHKASIRKGSQVVDIKDLSILDDDYIDVKTEIVADKRKILADLKEGKEIKGAELITKQSTINVG